METETMRIKIYDNGVQLWASANDTYDWARKPGAHWPCSMLANKRVFAEFDCNGLLDYAINGKYCDDFDVHEFNAMCADMIGEKLPKDHPCHFVVVGQFND